LRNSPETVLLITYQLSAKKFDNSIITYFNQLKGWFIRRRTQEWRNNWVWTSELRCYCAKPMYGRYSVYVRSRKHLLLIQISL